MNENMECTQQSIPKTMKREIVIFKNGKPNLVKNEDDYVKDLRNNKDRFDNGLQGEYVVSAFLNNDKCTTRGQTNFLKIINAITSCKYKPLKVTKTGFKTADLFFDSMKDANKILKDKDVRETVKCEITNRNLISRGVISDWDDSLIRLAEAIDNKNKYIMSIERMTRRRFSLVEKKYVPYKTNNFIVLFKNRYTPESVNLFGNLVKLKVRPYLPDVKQCYRCYQFGHTKVVCKNKERLCIICGDVFHGICDKIAKCVNCKCEHKANDKKCETYIYNKNVIKISVINNVSIYEAKKLYNSNEKGLINRNLYNAWSRPEDWPQLGENKQSDKGGPATINILGYPGIVVIQNLKILKNS
ncbi:uncharacterized protein [Cardiocondyla obscurior]|uniref:uncharacterized protein n=1 Tax=Cardiocondyla obscurior TaxID=286306 RepID=UPI0039655C20